MNMRENVYQGKYEHYNRSFRVSLATPSPVILSAAKNPFRISRLLS